MINEKRTLERKNNLLQVKKNQRQNEEEKKETWRKWRQDILAKY